MNAGSVIWLGQVQELSIDDSENKLINHYMGTANRNWDAMEQGPRDVTGTLGVHPTDLRLAFYSIGSIVEVSGATGTIATHGVTETNSDVWQSPFVSGTGKLTTPFSFTLEDSKQAPGTNRNFIRTVGGAIPNTVTVTATQGEKVMLDVDFIGQTLAFSSGTTTTLVDSGNSPYLWNDCSLTLAGSAMDTAKEISFEINNNLTASHYLNGSRDIAAPIVGNRDYTVNVTMDLDASDAAFLYNDYYKSNGSFNMTFDLNADARVAGSQHTTFYMSGCKITSMENPSVLEGTTETTIEVRPMNVTGSAYDTVHKYNPW